MKKRFIITSCLILVIGIAFTVTAYAGTENVDDAADNDEYFYIAAEKLGIDTKGMAFDELAIAVKEAEAAYYNANTTKLSEEEAKALYEKQAAEKMAQCNTIDPAVPAVREDMITEENVALYRDTMTLLCENTTGATNDEIMQKIKSFYGYYSAIMVKNGIDIDGWRITDVILKGQGMEQQANQPVNESGACNDYFYEAAKKFGINTEGMTFNDVEIAVKEAEVAYNNANTPESSEEELKALYEKQIAMKTDAMNK